MGNTYDMLREQALGEWRLTFSELVKEYLLSSAVPPPFLFFVRTARLVQRISVGIYRSLRILCCWHAEQLSMLEDALQQAQLIQDRRQRELLVETLVFRIAAAKTIAVKAKRHKRGPLEAQCRICHGPHDVLECPTLQVSSVQASDTRRPESSQNGNPSCCRVGVKVNEQLSSSYHDCTEVSAPRKYCRHCYAAILLNVYHFVWQLESEPAKQLWTGFHEHKS
eukprot:SAG31_NODE_4283_length_3381_cov_2.101767_4_plen_223_part_00